MKKYILLITLLFGACVVPDSVVIVNPPEEDPPILSSDILYEQTWQIASPDQLIPVDNGPIDKYITILKEGTTEFYLDGTIEGLDPTGARSIKITHNTTGVCCGVQIVMPNTLQLVPTQIWHDQWIKYDPHWTTESMNNCSVNEPFNLHSTIWWHSNESDMGRDQAVLGVWRINELFLSMSKAAGRPDGFTIGHLAMANQTYNPANIQMWDGQWHRLRFYISRPTPEKVQGWYTIWLDDTIIYDAPGWLVDTGSTLTWSTGAPHWEMVKLSNKMFCTPAAPQSMWFGRTTIYHKNPGWN